VMGWLLSPDGRSLVFVRKVTRAIAMCTSSAQRRLSPAGDRAADLRASRISTVRCGAATVARSLYLCVWWATGRVVSPPGSLGPEARRRLSDGTETVRRRRLATATASRRRLRTTGQYWTRTCIISVPTGTARSRAAAPHRSTRANCSRVSPDGATVAVRVNTFWHQEIWLCRRRRSHPLS